MENGSPTEIFRHLLNSRFHVFLEAEADPNITSSGKVIVSLIRSIFSHNPRNIRTALNRVDGLLPQRVNLELPKVFYLYPNASPNQELPPAEEETLEVTPQETATPERSIPDMSVRETTRELARLPYSTVETILSQASQTTAWFKAKGMTPTPKHTPYLKSVVAAHFVEMAANGVPDVVEDFFDSVDGRLTETIKVGEDIFLTSYETEAPPGALPNREGVLQIEATRVADTWGKALQKGKK